MKRITFLIAVLCMLQMNVNAQTLNKVYTGYDGFALLSIPKEYTIQNEPLPFSVAKEENGYSFSILNDDFSVGKQFSAIVNDTIKFVFPAFGDYDKHQILDDDNDLLLTQNLFNDDKKLEYIRAIVAPIYYEEWNETISVIKRFEIVNEDNEILCTVCLSEDKNWSLEAIGIFRLCEKDYLTIIEYNNESYTQRYEIYAINKNGGESSISKVKTLPGLSASPVFANRNSVVDVTIDEAAAANGGELMIVDNSGRIVAKRQFEPGQTTVSVQTDRMRTGVYNITLNNGAEIENARIIVK